MNEEYVGRASSKVCGCFQQLGSPRPAGGEEIRGSPRHQGHGRFRCATALVWGSFWLFGYLNFGHNPSPEQMPALSPGNTHFITLL